MPHYDKNHCPLQNNYDTLFLPGHMEPSMGEETCSCASLRQNHYPQQNDDSTLFTIVFMEL